MEIYIHIPFCIKKCSYCDFNSFAASDSEKSDYIEALLEEIACDEVIQGNSQADTVFIGGGTPSIMDARYIARILEKLSAKYSVSKAAEITIEANPGTVSIDKLKDLRNAGINRISIGVQSFDDNMLKILGRVHDREQAINAYEMARSAGFENINLDIMTQLPGQTMEMLKKDLSQAAKMSPEHMSVYSLIIEEGTPFYNRYEAGALKLPTEDETEEMDTFIHSFMKDNGYNRYEISNYSKASYKCRHNDGYWLRKAYRGYGLSAASLLKYQDGTEYRFTAERSLQDYLQDCRKELAKRDKAAEKYRRLCRNEQIEEFVFLGLRRCDGISDNEFKKVFSMSLNDQYSDILNKYIDMKYIKCISKDNDNLYSFTESGMQISNVILSEFLLDI